ncbi:MAG: hypothetical protein OXB84_03965, partial [Halobacteriovoraceae bacterium]|nr:hypothetical protein [Halobacteriovoraceae bacterium]
MKEILIKLKNRGFLFFFKGTIVISLIFISLVLTLEYCLDDFSSLRKPASQSTKIAIFQRLLPPDNDTVDFIVCPLITDLTRSDPHDISEYISSNPNCFNPFEEESISIERLNFKKHGAAFRKLGAIGTGVAGAAVVAGSVFLGIGAATIGGVAIISYGTTAVGLLAAPATLALQLVSAFEP